MRIINTLMLMSIFIPFFALGFNPGNLGADSSVAFSDTDTSFVLPGYDSLSESETGLPEALIALSFSSDDNPSERSRGIIHEEAKVGEYTYAELYGGGGLDDLRIEAFAGLEMDKFDMLARFYENDYYDSESPLNVRDREGQFGIMYSDGEGTVLGMNAQYLARRDIPSNLTLRYEKTEIDSGGVDLEYISNIWNDTKLTSRLGGIYSVYQTDTTRYRDYYLSAELGINAFLWADNLSRVKFTIVQDTLNLREERNLETLYGDISINNDIPLTDWMNVGLGFTRYMFMNEYLTSRNYAYGVLHFQIGRRTGLYIRYSPKLSVPAFQELYFDNDFTRISEFPLVLDNYFSIEAGLTERLSQNLTAGINVYQTRSRSYPVASDYSGDLGLDYFDAGRVRINGGIVEYTIDLFDFISNSGYYSIEDTVIESAAIALPYTPRDSAEVSLRFYYSDRFSFETALKRTGERLYRPGANLPAVYTIGIKGRVKLIDGLDVYLRGDNIIDEQYEIIRGIQAPGRTLSLGARLIL